MKPALRAVAGLLVSPVVDRRGEHDIAVAEATRITFEDFHVSRAPYDDAEVLRGPVVCDDGTVTAGVALIVPDGVAVRGKEGEMSRWGWRVASWPPARSVTMSLPHIETFSLAGLSRYLEARGQTPAWLQRQVAMRLAMLAPDPDDPPRLARAKQQRYVELLGEAATAWGQEVADNELLLLG